MYWSMELNNMFNYKTEFLYPFSIQHTCTCKTNFLCITDFLSWCFIVMILTDKETSSHTVQKIGWSKKEINTIENFKTKVLHGISYLSYFLMHY